MFLTCLQRISHCPLPTLAVRNIQHCLRRKLLRPPRLQISFKFLMFVCFFLLWQGSNAICIHLSFWIPIRSIFRLEVVFFLFFFFQLKIYLLGFFKQHGSISPESNWNWSRSRPLLSAASNSKDDSFWARILLVAWYLARIFLATRVYSYGVSSFWPSKTTNLLVLLASTALPILFPLGKAKREDSWSNSEPWGKQARDSSGRSCRGQCSTTPVGLWEACTSLSNLSLSLYLSLYIYKSISISMYIYINKISNDLVILEELKTRTARSNSDDPIESHKRI